MYARGVSRPSLAPYRSAPDSFGPLHVELAPYGLGLLGAYVMPATLVVIAAGPALVAAIIWRETQAVGALLVAVGLLTLGVALTIVAIVRAPSRRAARALLRTGLEFDDGGGDVCSDAGTTDIVQVRFLHHPESSVCGTTRASWSSSSRRGASSCRRSSITRPFRGASPSPAGLGATGGDGSAVDLNSEGT